MFKSRLGDLVKKRIDFHAPDALEPELPGGDHFGADGEAGDEQRRLQCGARAGCREQAAEADCVEARLQQGGDVPLYPVVVGGGEVLAQPDMCGFLNDRVYEKL